MYFLPWFACFIVKGCCKSQVELLPLARLHVTGVPHAAVSRLAGTLVGAGLQADLGVPALLDLLVGKVPLVLGRHLRPDLRPGVVGVLLGCAPECVETKCHLWDVAGLE